MAFRLLIDLEVLETLQALPRGRRGKVLAHLRKLQESPERYSDYIDQDTSGRQVDVSVYNGWAIFYWIDHADRQIKILQMMIAD